MKIQSTNPSRNFEVIGEVEASTEEEISKAVEFAQKAKKNWKSIGLEKRVEYLSKAFDALEKHADELAQLASREMGMPINDAKFDAKEGVHYLRWYADNAKKYLDPEITFESDEEINEVHREPRGVVAVIVPWNFPYSNFVWQVGQNLVAGNVVIFKHSEEVPLFSKKLAEVIKEAGLPEGVFTVIYGDGKVGDYLVHQNIDLICFTGSSAIGKYLYRVAAEKFIPVLMELGGSAPGVIFSDASIDEAIEVIMINRYGNCGQICDGLKRLIVHESRLQEVKEKLSKRMSELKIGDALDEATQMGPLVAERQVKALEEQVEDAIKKGAKVVTGGKRPEGLQGAYYEPTILVKVTPEMRVWKEEVFGPVLPVVTFTTEEEAIALANDTRYGLGGYVFTNDNELFQRVAEKLETGMVSQNSLSYVRPCNPFGGYKESGLGREHGKFGFSDITQAKIISKKK